jgi:hypothetical protein
VRSKGWPPSPAPPHSQGALAGSYWANARGLPRLLNDDAPSHVTLRGALGPRPNAGEGPGRGKAPGRSARRPAPEIPRPSECSFATGDLGTGYPAH